MEIAETLYFDLRHAEYCQQRCEELEKRLAAGKLEAQLEAMDEWQRIAPEVIQAQQRMRKMWMKEKIRRAASVCTRLPQLANVTSQLTADTNVSWCHDGIDAAQFLQNPISEAICRGHLAAALDRSGDFGQALDTYQESIDALASLKCDEKVSYFASRAAVLAFEHGDQRLGTWLACAERAEDGHNKCRVHILRARIAGRMQVRAEADDELVNALRIARQQGCQTCLAQALYWQGAFRHGDSPGSGYLHLFQSMLAYGDALAGMSVVTLAESLCELAQEPEKFEGTEKSSETPETRERLTKFREELARQLAIWVAVSEDLPDGGDDGIQLIIARLRIYLGLCCRKLSENANAIAYWQSALGNPHLLDSLRRKAILEELALAFEAAALEPWSRGLWHIRRKLLGSALMYALAADNSYLVCRIHLGRARTFLDDPAYDLNQDMNLPIADAHQDSLSFLLKHWPDGINEKTFPETVWNRELLLIRIQSRRGETIAAVERLRQLLDRIPPEKAARRSFLEQGMLLFWGWERLTEAIVLCDEQVELAKSSGSDVDFVGARLRRLRLAFEANDPSWEQGIWELQRAFAVQDDLRYLILTNKSEVFLAAARRESDQILKSVFLDTAFGDAWQARDFDRRDRLPMTMFHLAEVLAEIRLHWEKCPDECAFWSKSLPATVAEINDLSLARKYAVIAIHDSVDLCRFDIFFGLAGNMRSDAWHSTPEQQQLIEQLVEHVVALDFQNMGRVTKELLGTVPSD